MNITLTSGKEIPCSPDRSILDSLKESNNFLTASCGGKGTCGKCKVIIKSGKADIQSTIKLTEDEISNGYAIACRTFPSEDLILEIPKESVLTVEGKVATEKADDLIKLFNKEGADIDPYTERSVIKLPPPSLDDNISDLERIKREIIKEEVEAIRIPFRYLADMAKTVRKSDWEITICTIHTDEMHEITNILPGNQGKPQYGAAIDIGTTTIALYLVDLTNGELVDIGSTYNSQIAYGDDVITRIVNATENNEMDNIHRAVIDDINELMSVILATHNINIDSVDCFMISANTTMTHLFLGLDPAAIREEPYIPTANFFPVAFCGELGINASPNVPVYSFPCIASYVGGDIVSGVLATGMHRHEEISIFIDIGTNGEIVVGNSEWLMSAACSAGPCFEGSGIRDGMRATEGAIENVTIDRESLDFSIRVIGDDTKPQGICGSGMIDLIAEMYFTGILDMRGKLQKSVSDRVREGEEGLEVVIHFGEDKDIVLTEVDIENILRAKAAIFGGFTTLLGEVGLTFDDVQKVYIAGGFGKYLNIEKAIILGMLPDMPIEKFEYRGNTSVTGAYLCILSQKLRWEAEEVAKQMTYIELSVSNTFMDEYTSGLFIPHTNIESFPTVKAMMEKG